MSDMSYKILGLYDAKLNEWDKLAYLHINSGGGACVNGSSSEITLRNAGEPIGEECYSIVVPPNFKPPLGGYIALNKGECLLRLGDDEKLSVVVSGFACVSSKLEAWRPINAAVLTVSDKGSRGERADTAGPALADMAESLGVRAAHRDIVPDERGVIADKLKTWADSGEVNLILTTGGTGLSRRDVTPEAIMDIHDRTVPGFGEIMRAHSMRYTPRGFLTRSLAVTRKDVLIIAFPGSERAVRQCFEAIAPGLRHAVEILCGRDAECGGHGGGRR